MTSRELIGDQAPAPPTAVTCSLPGPWTTAYGGITTINKNLTGTMKLPYCSLTHSLKLSARGNSFTVRGTWSGGTECQSFTESMAFSNCHTASGTWQNDGGGSGTDTWTRDLISVSFAESGTNYGWDDHTDAALPWKSVGKGKKDTVWANITPLTSYKSCYFESLDTFVMAVKPVQATSAKQSVSITGVAKGTSELYAKDAETDVKTLNVATYEPVSKTVAVTLVHKKSTGAADPGYTSTDISDADIKAMLKTVYKQAAKSFTVKRQRAKTVAFDTNKDGKIDVDSWMSGEMAIIRDACQTDHDYNIFIVSHPTDGSTGFMSFNQKYGYIHADTGANSRTVAHELGHGQGLQHTIDDTENIMYNYTSNTKWRLRKGQWDTINP